MVMTAITGIKAMNSQRAAPSFSAAMKSGQMNAIKPIKDALAIIADESIRERRNCENGRRSHCSRSSEARTSFTVSHFAGVENLGNLRRKGRR